MVPCHALMSVAAIFVVDLFLKKMKLTLVSSGQPKLLAELGQKKKTKKQNMI